MATCEKCKTDLAVEDAEKIIIDAKKPFPDEGHDALHDEIRHVIRELIEEFCRISIRHTAGSIFADYVRRARSNIFMTSKGRWIKQISVFGGLFPGTGLSSLMTVSGRAGETMSALGWLSVIFFVTVGTAMIAWSIDREYPPSQESGRVTARHPCTGTTAFRDVGTGTS